MTLVKFNRRNLLFPWNNNRLKDFLSSDEFFNDDFFTEDSLMPAMNVIDHKKDLEIEFAAPGFEKKDFEVTIENNILHVCGEKEEKQEEKEEDFTRKEFSYKSFKRSFRLPDSVNDNANVKATYKNGILKLKMEKKNEAIEVAKKKIDVV
ncbi:MAG: Hsp20/alpha crystallin family protein [Flavobacteriaceae bacterium]|nr:Hsp20/alpha crystallin family protein [Flavobacteriaceae bacterium]